MLNQFPVRNGGVSSTISPTEIVEGIRKPDMGIKKINFGQYAEIHDGTDNTTSERSKGAIAMYATNDREGYVLCVWIRAETDIQITGLKNKSHQK